MQCLCAPSKSAKGKNSAEEECAHSFCVVRRQKKQTKCVDLPPKGLPWASGHLKYLPGQRNLYKELYLQDQTGQEAAAAKAQPAPPPKKWKGKGGSKRQSEGDMACLCYCAPTDSRKKRRSKSVCQKPSDTGSQESSNKQNYCVEFEEILVCDGTNAQPRKGYLVRASKRPEADQAVAAANEVMRSSEEESPEDSAADKGVICLCVPRAYLQQYRGPEEDLCAKYGVKMECPEKGKPHIKSSSEKSVHSKKSDFSKGMREGTDLEDMDG